MPRVCPGEGGGGGELKLQFDRYIMITKENEREAVEGGCIFMRHRTAVYHHG